MQTQLNRFITFLALKFAVLVMLFLSFIALLIVYNQTLLQIFYYLDCVALAGMACTGLLVLRDFVILSRCNLFEAENKEELLKLDLPTDNLALQVGLAYRNHATYAELKTNFALKDNTEVLRNIQKCLDILFKEHAATLHINTVAHTKDANGENN